MMIRKSGLPANIIKRWVTDNFLNMSHEIFKSRKPYLSLQMSILAKMSSGMAKKIFSNREISMQEYRNHNPPIFSSKALLNTKNVTQTGKTSFQV